MPFSPKKNKTIDKCLGLCYNMAVKEKEVLMITYTFTNISKHEFTNGNTAI